MNRIQNVRSLFGKKPAAPESPLTGDQLFGAAPVDEGFQYNPIRQEVIEPKLAELGFTLPADPNDPEFDDLVERVRQVDQGLAIDLVGMREPINTYHENKIMQEARAKSDRSNMIREFIDDKLYIYNARGERVLNKKIMVGLGVLVVAALFPIANIKLKPAGDAGASIGTTTQNADGSSTTNFEDGTVVNKLADGTEITRKPNGEVSTKTADGVTTTSYADGRKVVTQADGSTIETLPDGSTTRRDASGQVIENTPPTTASLTSPLSTTTIKPGPQGGTGTGPVNAITGLPIDGGTTVSSPDPATANLDPITGLPVTDTSAATGTPAGTVTPTAGGPALNSNGFSDFGNFDQGSQSTAATPEYADPYGSGAYSTTGGGTLGAASGTPVSVQPATPVPVAVTPVQTSVTPAQPTPITAGSGAPAPRQAVTVQPPVATPAPATARTTVMRVNAASTGSQGGQGSGQSSGQGQGQAGSGNNEQGTSVIYRKPAPPSTAVMRASSVTTSGAGATGANSSGTFVYRRASASAAGTQGGASTPSTVASGTARTPSSAQQSAAQSAAGAAQNAGTVTAPGSENLPASELFTSIFGTTSAPTTQAQAAAGGAPAAAATVPSPYRLGQRFSATLNTGVFVAQSSPSGLPVYAMSADGTMWRGWPTLDATKRVMITFDRAVLKDGQEVAVQAAGYNLDGTPGVKARYYDIAPTLANDIIRSGISGVNDFVQGKLNATRTTTNSNGSTVVEKQAPSIYESIGGATARVFTLPAAQNTFVTVAEIPVNTQIAIVYGPTTSDMNR